jgi:predicted DNA-binding ribbon-helix-helix protein
LREGAARLWQGAAKRCKVLHRIQGRLSVAAKRGRKHTGKSCATRASASLPPELYSTLKDIARQKKVSVAWVIRDAAETYIAGQWPLLEGAR